MEEPFDFDAEAVVAFAEDLTYSEVAPLLEALTNTRVFRVRASRVAWSGPAAGGPEVGLILAAVATIGAGAFAKTFCEELAKDAYRAVRSGVIGVVRRLREKKEPRAVVPLVIQVGTLRVGIGSTLYEQPAPDEWTDEWLIEILRQAQEIVDTTPSLIERQPFEPGATFEHWIGHKPEPTDEE